MLFNYSPAAQSNPDFVQALYSSEIATRVPTINISVTASFLEFSRCLVFSNVSSSDASATLET
jgi:hypothetical protein